MKHLYVLVLILLSTAFADAIAQPELSRRDVATGLRVPMDIAWGPDDWIWIAEKGGRVSRLDPSTGEMRTVYQIPDLWEATEAGLIGMAVYPTLRDSPYVFLAWTYYEEAEVRMKLVRFKFNGTTLRDSLMIFHRVAANAYTNGGRMTVTPDRKILMTVGDADQNAFAMSPFFLGGKVLRMNLDGSVPSDNPSRLAPTPINLLWSWGHRDGRGIVALPGGTVFEVEQGKDSVDELNNIQRRRNYGWPRVIGMCDQVDEQKPCSDSNVATPVRMWRNSIYPSGIEHYNNPAIPEFANSLLMVTLDEKDMRQLKLSGSTITEEIVHFDGEFGRLRDLCVSPDGRVFLATSNRDEKGIGTNFQGSDKIIEIGGNRALALLGTPVITGDSMGSFHAGDSVVATFSASNFDPANVFTLEISDRFGSFLNARAIGAVAGHTNSSIVGVIPCDTLGASGYRFRIVANNPSAIKTDATTGFRIIAPVPAVISPSVSISFCPGDSVIFRGRLGVENRWSTGEVGDSIIVRDAGSYFVVAYTNGCPRFSDTISVSVAPLPQPNIQLLGQNTLDAGNRFAAYRWYRNDTLLSSTSRSIQVTVEGTYTVAVRSDVGCWNTSAPFVFSISGVAGGLSDANGLRVYPHPTRARLTLDLASTCGGVVNILVNDVRGREVMRARDDAAGGLYRRDIDVSELASGVYVVSVRCDGESWSARFVRQ